MWKGRHAIGIAVLAFGLLGGADANPKREHVDALQRRYNGVRDLRADFEQESHILSIDRKDLSSGKLVVVRPGRMRWEYDKPAHRLIVLNKDTLKIYSPEDKQLQVAPVADGNISPTALSFLLGDALLRDVFMMRATPTVADGEIEMVLYPKSDSGFDSLELTVGAEDYELRRSVVVDLFGNRTTVRFANLVENRGTTEEDFSIAVPDDTEVIDLR